MKWVLLSLLFSLFFFFLNCNDVDYNEKSVNRTSRKILIDASHDGGVWWSPQSGTYSASLPHQGKLMADFLRSYGFTVDELPSFSVITDSILQQYDKVIRAGCFGTYQPSELQAYVNYTNRPTSLFLIGEYLNPAQIDQLAENLGIHFQGIYYGNLDTYAPHIITDSATSFYYNAGSIIVNAGTNPAIIPLGWLDGDNNKPSLGILQHPFSKILFIGDINGIESLPQPLTLKIFKWLFG